MDERHADHAKELLHEGVALGAVARVERRVIELDGDDRRECRLIAEDEVHLLVGDPVEGRLVHVSVSDLAEVAEVELQKDEKAVADHELEYVVEVELGRRQQRLAPIWKARRREKSQRPAFLLRHSTRDGKLRSGPVGTSTSGLQPDPRTAPRVSITGPRTARWLS